jgi:hypothetical protein
VWRLFPVKEDVKVHRERVVSYKEQQRIIDINIMENVTSNLQRERP